MTYDFTIIPGTSGTVQHPLGLALRYKDSAGGIIDLSSATLHFVANDGSKTVLGVASPTITWDSATGEILIPISVADTREIGKCSWVNYSIEYRAGAAQHIILRGNLKIDRVPNDD